MKQQDTTTTKYSTAREEILNYKSGTGAIRNETMVCSLLHILAFGEQADL